MHRSIISSEGFQENPKHVGIIISDVRFKNEADKILSQPNGMIIYFDASDEVRNQRMMKRDGHLMTAEQSSHKSEKECDLVKEISSAIIVTDNLSIDEQTNKTLEIINEFINVYA